MARRTRHAHTPETAESKPAGQRSRRLPTLRLALIALLLLGLAAAAGIWQYRGRSAVPVFTYEVVNTYPHDPRAFSQGLVFHEGQLYEGTGRYGESSLRRVDLQTGRVLESRQLPQNLFGEGITIYQDRIFQLTWRSNYGLIYDLAKMQPSDTFSYAGEGWGLTHDGRHMIMSDGSDTLRFLDPKTFRTVRTIRVRAYGRPVEYLNELEYVDGEILANVWHTDLIARINPATGEVNSWVDLRGLLSPAERPDAEAVLNGIAWDAREKRLFVTGKNWPKLFEIRVEPRRDSDSRRVQ